MKQNEISNLYKWNDSTGIVKKYFSEDRASLMPLIITPENSPVNIVEWITLHRDYFKRELMVHGAILFRGFGTDTAEQFNEFMKCFDTAPMRYMFRSSPREELNKKLKNIYQSTTYPNERSIEMHNESSYSRMWGMKIVFCCIQPAEEGGETPLADSRRVLKDVPLELVEKFKKKSVRYWRNLTPGLGMPWQEVFQTDKKADAKKICLENSIDFEFRGDQMITHWEKPAVYKHPVTFEETWFNHVLFFHKYSRYQELDMSHDETLPEEYLTSQVFFGDGSEISFGEYVAIKNAYQKNKVVFQYVKGDIIFLDNMLVAHGRNSYKGQRTIATAIIEPINDCAFFL